MNTAEQIDTGEGVHLAYNCDEMVRSWVSRELDIDVGGDNFRAIGAVLDGRMIAGIVFYDYQGFMAQCSIATIDPQWCTRSVLKSVFDYAFGHLGCKRLHGACAKKNKKMRNLFDRLGFKYEGNARKAFDGEQDAMIYSMLNNECRWT